MTELVTGPPLRVSVIDNKRGYGVTRSPLPLERPTGFEPATSSLGSWHSATELRPRLPPSLALPAGAYLSDMS